MGQQDSKQKQFSYFQNDGNGYLLICSVNQEGISFSIIASKSGSTQYYYKDIKRYEFKESIYGPKFPNHLELYEAIVNAKKNGSLKITDRMIKFNAMAADNWGQFQGCSILQKTKNLTPTQICLLNEIQQQKNNSKADNFVDQQNVIKVKREIQQLKEQKRDQQKKISNQIAQLKKQHMNQQQILSSQIAQLKKQLQESNTKFRQHMTKYHLLAQENLMLKKMKKKLQRTMIENIDHSKLQKMGSKVTEDLYCSQEQYDEDDHEDEKRQKELAKTAIKSKTSQKQKS